MVFIRSERLQQVILMLQRNGMEQILDFVDLKDGELNFFAFVGLRVKRANGDPFPYFIVVDRDVDDFFSTVLDVGLHGRVWANGNRGSTTGRESCGTHCAGNTCVEAGGVGTAQRFQHLATHDERAGIRIVKVLHCSLIFGATITS